MKLLLKRIAKRPTYTIGKLYIDGKYFCDTLEDTDRGINQNDSITKIKSVKIQHKTAIPTGTYKVAMNIVSPRYSNYSKYKYVKPFGAKMPRVLNVPGFEGILIHPGNTPGDTSGCLLVGQNKVVGKVINSQATWINLMNILLTDKNNITITIE